MSNGVDLLKLFSSVTNTLQDNQQALNTADTHNGDHGDNMVEIFQMISNAIGDTSSGMPAEQLSHAAQALVNKQSGSAQLYAQGLTQAAQQFQGKQVDAGNALQLIQTLMGAGSPPPQPQADPLSSLLGGFLGGGQAEEKGEGEPLLDSGDLLNAGLAFLSAKQRGETNQEAIMNALLAASPFSQTQHRKQSSQLVAETLLDTLTKMTH